MAQLHYHAMQLVYQARMMMMRSRSRRRRRRRRRTP
jgi:hypothetical protein